VIAEERLQARGQRRLVAGHPYRPSALPLLTHLWLPHAESHQAPDHSKPSCQGLELSIAQPVVSSLWVSALDSEMCVTTSLAWVECAVR